MPADITLGDNYQIDENSNGNLVIIDSSGNPVLEHTNGGGWSINTSADINDLTDSTSGNTVYDSSTETFGDGTQTGNFNTGNFNSVNTDKVATNRNWDDVTGARALDTTETNNTGSDIEISCTAQASSDGTDVDVILSIGGQIYVDRFDQVLNTGEQGTVRGTVPDGQTYEIIAFGDSANYSINHFLELTP